MLPSPADPHVQRLTTRQWEAAVAGVVTPETARPLVRESWQRSLAAEVPATLAAAPRVLADDAVHEARERLDWLPFAHRAAGQLLGGAGAGHVLTFFDADGRMLAGEGDPAALDGLQAINFCPGGLWTESAAGTNGPGTALATGRPVHIVGAEHFCERWQQWHCAAVPLRDQLTGALVGAIDLSGFRDLAHPHSFDLVIALGVAVEQMLAARDVERRYRVLHRLMELAARHPTAPLVAADRGGAVLLATAAVPAGLRPESTVPAALRRAMARAVGAATGPEPREVALTLFDDVCLTSVCHPVRDGAVPIGGVFLLADVPGARATPTPPAALEPRARPGGGARRAPRPRDPGAQAGTPAAGSTTRYTFLDVIGHAAPLADACRVAAVAAANTLPVLLTGESGTGKEVFAQAIHRAGPRRERAFVAVNCAALPRELVESELLGYVGGAFSGARPDGSPGRFVAADGGTIFLDEVAELPPAAQAALLRVLQEGEVTPLGGTAARRVDVRVIAATNRDVARSLTSGALREDLYYRLDVLRIHLPPLRERPDDIPALARRFLDDAAADLGRPDASLAPEVLALFGRHPWPGNVRELRNLVRRLVALAPGGRVTRADLAPEFLAACGGEAADVTAAAGPGWAHAPAAPPAASHAAVATEAPVTGAAVPDEATPDPERARTLDAVQAAPTMAAAARRLGITRSTLYRRLARYGVHVARELRRD